MKSAFQRDLVALGPKLRRFALSLTNDQADADDLVQAACEKAIVNVNAFRAGTRMDSWMYRIIQNHWIDDRRRAKTRGSEIDHVDAGLSDLGRAASEPAARLMLGKVREAMSTLPDDQRLALSLVAIEGLTYRETAEALDVPIGTVMSRLARAREKLAPLAASEGSLQ